MLNVDRIAESWRRSVRHKTGFEFILRIRRPRRLFRKLLVALHPLPRVKELLGSRHKTLAFEVYDHWRFIEL